MRGSVEEHIARFAEFSNRKLSNRQPSGLLRHHESFQPTKIIASDYLGLLPETLNKKRFIIIAIDHFTRFVDGKAVKDHLAERLVRYFAEYVGRFGIPEKIVVDNAKQFDNKSLDAKRQQFIAQKQVAPVGHHKGKQFVNELFKV